MRYTLVIAILGALLVAAIALPRRQFSTSSSLLLLLDYCASSLQSAGLPSFTTNDGKQFCTNPKAPWVPDVLRALIMTN
ncbi:uncharacterized protein LOC125309781 isoform X2 [Alosa alosa]|uniref:uncharacterized protein LOC125309781 isoform X2 n=1 Tax=Alosa alosa TaxID=278164 RepID=UPI0020153EB8|nr:uncharacterized protein LOC125309781 isoform X2 [Alosa alosa]